MSKRSIDAYLPPAPRQKPMKVLCLGMSRTGTESLYAALQKLGYRSYKIWEILKDFRTSIPLWNQALDAKFKGVGKVWGREEFDVMLGNYDSALDLPIILFSEELIRAYPEAKVVLTLREETSWLRSMRDTLGEELSWWTYPYIWHFFQRTRLRVGFLWNCFECLCKKDLSDEGPAIDAFRQHYALVKKLVPPERLLEFRSEQGWAPLCQFLGEPIPNEPYPRINNRAYLKRILAGAYYMTLAMAVMQISTGILGSVWLGRYIMRRRFSLTA